MQKKWIKNYDELAISKNREIALQIAEAGLDAINTESVIKKNITLSGNILRIQNSEFDLAKYKNIRVVGFGKCSCEAAFSLEEILKDKINSGAVVGLSEKICPIIKTFAGTHPRPSSANILPGQKIYDIANQAEEDDLIIAIVSGGGSALLCYPELECSQGETLYNTFLKTGNTISEINTVRKHISELKGGGLAKIAYPATVVGLIFSDVPGDKYEDVASGPTYKDVTTKEDAEKIITHYNLGEFILNETPKEDKYFEKVHNFVLVSNKTALTAMEQKANQIGLDTIIVSSELYDEIDISIEKIFSNTKNKTVVLAAGEPRLIVTKKGGSGGRNLYLGLKAVEKIQEGSVFIPMASDGMDNSPCAGAIVDTYTRQKIKDQNIDTESHLENFDALTVFEKTKDNIMTGPTNANVSDIMILLNNKNE
jgi:glycerate 2-kinase